MNDPRKEYVVQCIISVLNIPRSEFRSNTSSNTALEKFLDHPNEKVLQAVENDLSDSSKRTVTLQLGFASYAEGIPEMHFIKTSYEPLTEQNISRLVLISSLRMSPVRSLFYNVREVFMPLLVESGKDSEPWRTLLKPRSFGRVVRRIVGKGMKTAGSTHLWDVLSLLKNNRNVMKMYDLIYIM